MTKAWSWTAVLQIAAGIVVAAVAVGLLGSFVRR